MEHCICIHAHFYQPPRENPWLEAIERQVPAHPYHDWNGRIDAECYRPNGMARILDGSGRIDRIVNNYARISFNFGPTLLSWLAAEDPAAYAKILDADRESRDRFSGHGSAIAQAYNHPILPLCNSRDKETQIRWGLRDFTHRFGRAPEAMWLPETAADLETLDRMARMGLRYAILAPHQAARVRKKSERAWHEVAGQDIDPSMPYELELPGGRTMALFFYDGPISRAVGFEKLLADGEAFAQRLMRAFSPQRVRPQLVHIATDGETYGHHHKFGEMALAYALHAIESGKKARLTNYGEYLERHPPTHAVEIRENGSWSCPHGTGRWSEDCGCSTGAHPGWRQEWRAPLRRALDWLRDTAAGVYEEGAAGLLRDPWAARDGYIDVMLDRSPESAELFLRAHARRELDAAERVRAFKLQELQRHAMLMYTSCGWFFDDISRIETVQILRYAARSIELAEDLSGGSGIETGFLEILRGARSNEPELGDGRDIYEKFVRPARIGKNRVAAHVAVRSLFEEPPPQAEFYSYRVDRQTHTKAAGGAARLAAGRCTLLSRVTQESSGAEYAALLFGDGRIVGGGKNWGEEAAFGEFAADITGVLERNDAPAAQRRIEDYFGRGAVSLEDLFPDERQFVLETQLRAATAALESCGGEAYAAAAPAARSLMRLGIEPPESFRTAAALVLRSRLLHTLEAGAAQPEAVMRLLEEARLWKAEPDRRELALTLRRSIEALAERARGKPGDIASLRELAAAVDLASALSLDIDYYQTQNLFCEMLREGYPSVERAAGSGDEGAAQWVREFRDLGRKLSVRMD